MESVSKDWTQINKKLIGNKAKPSGHLKLWLKNGGFRCLRMSLRGKKKKNLKEKYYVKSRARGTNISVHFVSNAVDSFVPGICSF